jgi:CRISPR-associated exonuclease Cas4
MVAVCTGSLMESLIKISQLNDFIFCPKSIYFHDLYYSFAREIFQDKVQIEGEKAHESIDNKTYSSRKNVLQSIDVFSEKYGLVGKIDVFNVETGILTERKKRVQKIYDGFVFQVYAHFFCLQEMGYDVKKIIIHELDRNKNYEIPLPSESIEMFEKFENLISEMKSYDPSSNLESLNIEKCKNCIYSNLCDESLC